MSQPLQNINYYRLHKTVICNIKCLPYSLKTTSLVNYCTSTGKLLYINHDIYIIL